MILNGKRWMRPVPQPLDRGVIQIDVRHLYVGGERPWIDGEAVILRRDLHLARFQLLHRMIGAAVAEFQFERRSAHGETETATVTQDVKVAPATCPPAP